MDTKTGQGTQKNVILLISDRAVPYCSEDEISKRWQEQLIKYHFHIHLVLTDSKSGNQHKKALDDCIGYPTRKNYQR